MEAHERFGYSKDEAAKIKNFKPFFKLQDLTLKDTVTFVLLQDYPDLIDFEQDNDDGTKTIEATPIILTKHQASGMDYTLSLKNLALRRELFNLMNEREKNNLTLKGAVIKIQPYLYDTEKVVGVKGYRISQQ